MQEMNNDLLHDALLDRKPLLRFDENADFETWREQIRQKYIELLGLDEIAQNACDIKAAGTSLKNVTVTD